MSSINWRSQLRRYQLEGAQWLCETAPNRRGRILADPRGFGKTVQAIAAARMRQEAGYDGHCIPVLTSAVARGDWRRELKRWWPEAHVHIVSMDDVVSRKKKTKKGVTVWQESLEDLQVRRQAEWVPALRGERGITFLIAAYQSARTVLDQALKHEVLFDSIICDEAHALSHYHTETSKAVRPLVSKSRTAFLLTGTPIYNRPYDLYNLLETCVAGYGSSM